MYVWPLLQCLNALGLHFKYKNMHFGSPRDLFSPGLCKALSFQLWATEDESLVKTVDHRSLPFENRLLAAAQEAVCPLRSVVTGSGLSQPYSL